MRVVGHGIDGLEIQPTASARRLAPGRHYPVGIGRNIGRKTSLLRKRHRNNSDQSRHHQERANALFHSASANANVLKAVTERTGKMATTPFAERWQRTLEHRRASYFNRSATLATPALAQASSCSRVDPALPTAPTVSVPT